MDLIAFIPPAHADADLHWPQMLSECWGVGKVETHPTLEGLAQRLGHPRQEPFLLLLHAASQPYLERLLALRDLMAGLPVICILPDDQPDTMAKGHLLRPRLLLAQNEPPETIEEILRKFQLRVTPTS